MCTFDGKLRYRLMNEMEYVEWYSTHLLEKYEQDGEEYVFNDLSLTNDVGAESNAKKLGIEKERFIKELTYRYNNVAPKLNYNALWKLSLYLYQYLYLFPVALTKIREADEYMKLLTFVDKYGIDKIQFVGSKDGKNKTVSIENDELITKILRYLVSEHDSIMSEEKTKHYDVDINRLIPSKEYEEESTLDWAFIQELTLFFKSYLGVDELSPSIKIVIMTILIVFKKEEFVRKERKTDKEVDSLDTLNMKYARIMSDAKKDRIIKNLHSHAIGILNGEPMPFTILTHPESVRIRLEYEEMINKYRKKN